MAEEAVVVEAVRTPLGLSGGDLAGVHPARLLGLVYRELLERAGPGAGRVDHVVCGTQTQAGEQSGNVARTAWLAAGLPSATAATTVDCREASAQHAALLSAALVMSGTARLALSCGVEVMSRIPPSAATQRGPGLPRPPEWPAGLPGEFDSAERTARSYGIGPADARAVALLSRERAFAAGADGSSARETCAVPVTGAGPLVTADEGARDRPDRTRVAGERPVVPGGVHTAASTAPAGDGAAGLLWTTPRVARELGLRPRARVVAQVTVGVDPDRYVDGAVEATRIALGRAGLKAPDVRVAEIDEPFAAVVLGWARSFGLDDTLNGVNTRGGALALGRPAGASGARLMTTALSRLEDEDHEFALVATAAEGAQASATVLQRI